MNVGQRTPVWPGQLNLSVQRQGLKLPKSLQAWYYQDLFFLTYAGWQYSEYADCLPLRVTVHVTKAQSPSHVFYLQKYTLRA